MASEDIQTLENDSNKESKILNQVEYYFSEYNLPRDTFMNNQLKENNGWFPLEKLMTFNRLKELCTDSDVVVKVVKNSSEVELSECGNFVRRSLPLPEFTDEYKEKLNQRTLHIKGFPSSSNLEDLEKFCKQFGPISSLEMRREKSKAFKGCIFVIYKDEENAKKALLSELIYEGKELLKEDKNGYLQRKKKYHEQRKMKLKHDKIVQFKNAIMKIANLSSETDFMDLKQELSKHSKVAYVSNTYDNTGQWWIRFADQNGAKVVLDLFRKEMDNAPEDENTASGTLLGQEVNFFLVNGQEEFDFWQARSNHLNSKRSKWQSKKYKGNGCDTNEDVKVDNEGDNGNEEIEAEIEQSENINEMKRARDNDGDNENNVEENSKKRKSDENE